MKHEKFFIACARSAYNRFPCNGFAAGPFCEELRGKSIIEDRNFKKLGGHRPQSGTFWMPMLHREGCKERGPENCEFYR